MITKEEAYKTVQALVKRFEEQLDSYRQADYNETLTRRDFIDPFFKALGWDIDNSQGYAEAYREVIHEDKVKVGKATKAPDYSFRLPGGKRLFFVEAKKPSVTVKDNIFVAYQIRRYGWSAKLAISIITDFEEFAVYDCTKKPQLTDKAGVARIKFINFKDYLNEFDYLWETFSKEHVLKGSFDRYIQSDTIKKGTATVDKEFLSSLDKWRTYIATTISLKNKDLDEEEINFAVQLIINRLIFLRIAEDRGVEQYGQLRNSVNQKGESYQNLFYNFKKADEKYNSGLFDFKKDVISEKLQIDNKVIKTIVNEMYYPESPYEFSVISVEILGSAYEQFLGKVIRITPAHHAKIEEKPEVRKAGGVYYTPQYIVDYIVKNTVGKLIEGKTPKQIEKIKIADPACGSGSFLIGAYQYLLDYHKNYYTENGTKTGKKDSPNTPEGNLTSAEKKKILLNNIFGVDIDVNAVEVTKLSLLLKCMEGETETTIAQQQKLWHERVLPTLDENIKSGNSLIDTDFYDSQLDFGEDKKIKPFNWQKGFPEIFKQGGFDVVIGNPPYSLIGSDRKDEQGYFTSGRYELNSYKINTYILFLERGFKFLKYDSGILGYIIPKSLVFNTYFETTRKKILQEFSIPQIVEIREKVFEDAEVGDSILFFGERKSNPLKNLLKYYKVENVFPTFKIINSFAANQKSLLNDYDGKFFPIGIKIRIDTIPLKEICNIYNGLNPGNVRHILLSKENINAKYKKLLLGRDIQRYSLSWSGTWVNYDPTLKNRLKPSDIKSKAGMTAQEKVDFALRDENIYLGNKIVVRKTADHIVATYDSNEFYYDSLSYGIKLQSNKSDISLPFILGLLSSKLINYIHEGLSNNKDKVFAKVLAANLSILPIPKSIFTAKQQKEKHDAIDKLVNQILQLNSEKATVKLESKINQLQSKIDYCEDRINQIVYQIYELTEEDIKIVEGSV